MSEILEWKVLEIIDSLVYGNFVVVVNNYVGITAV